MFYFDMDGVLCKYDRTAYEDPDPIFLREDSHYFRLVEPDPTAMKIFRNLYKMLPGQVKVLTGVSAQHELRFQQTVDKIYWIHEQMPEFDVGADFMAVSTNKRETVSEMKGVRLMRSDILVDDWNPNLYSWEAGGGTAVKYINGLNSEGSWPGKSIKCNDNIEFYVHKLQKLWYDIQRQIS